MTLYFLRHGETDYNLEMKMQGWIDIPLNDTGVRQAEDAGKRIRKKGIGFDMVFSSPLVRALRTAEIVTGQDRSDILVDRRLIEMGFGDYEGKRFEHIPDDVFDLIRRAPKGMVPGGAESPEEVLERTKDFLDHLKTVNGGASILCVAHGVTIRAMLSNLNRDGKSIPWAAKVGNCALFMTELRDGSYTQLRQIL